jgi:hypothetical protein
MTQRDEGKELSEGVVVQFESGPQNLYSASS